MSDRYSRNARVFKAFCDENRLMILELLHSGEKCACILLARLNISQSTLSHHMKILVASGVVNARKEGKWTHYSISESGSKEAILLLSDLTTASADDNGKRLAADFWGGRYEKHY